jgi:exosortase/archaeosortase family protein
MFKDSKEKELVVFFIKLFLIWLSWKGFIHIIGEQSTPFEERYFPKVSEAWENFNFSLVRFLAVQSAAILNFIGYKAYSFNRIVWIEGYNGVSIGNYCIGLQLMYYFSLLIIISGISFKNKVIAIPTGIFITQVLNVIRIVVMNLVTVYTPKLIVFFHDHVFNIVVFGTLIAFYYYLNKTK